MKIMEFIELVNSNKSKMLKAEQLSAFIKKTIEVKEYLGIKQKKALVDSIVDECIFYEDGVFKFDEIEKYICFTMRTVAAYTNLELSDDIEEDYDTLCREKILEVVIATFKPEYDEVSILLQMKCDFVLNNNGIEAQVGRFLSDLSEKIDDFASVMENVFANIDFSKLPINKDQVVKLIDFIEKQK